MAPLLAGHVAAVTGGGSGIGQGICQAYAREGARVFVLDANLASAHELMALFGWLSLAEARRYTRSADRRTLSQNAARLLSRGNKAGQKIPTRSDVPLRIPSSLEKA